MAAQALDANPELLADAVGTKLQELYRRRKVLQAKSQQMRREKTEVVKEEGGAEVIFYAGDDFQGEDGAVKEEDDEFATVLAKFLPPKKSVSFGSQVTISEPNLFDETNPAHTAELRQIALGDDHGKVDDHVEGNVGRMVTADVLKRNVVDDVDRERTM